MFTFILCVAFLVGALICYASCCISADADYRAEKMAEKFERENLKK
jgi:hypothetical protein